MKLREQIIGYTPWNEQEKKEKELILSYMG